MQHHSPGVVAARKGTGFPRTVPRTHVGIARHPSPCSHPRSSLRLLYGSTAGAYLAYSIPTSTSSGGGGGPVTRGGVSTGKRGGGGRSNVTGFLKAAKSRRGLHGNISGRRCRQPGLLVRGGRLDPDCRRLDPRRLDLRWLNPRWLDPRRMVFGRLDPRRLDPRCLDPSPLDLTGRVAGAAAAAAAAATGRPG